MLQDLASHGTDKLTRAQLATFHTCCDQIGLHDDGRRHALGLDDSAWSAWSDFLDDGPLPPEPPLPEMLQRLGTTTFSLSFASEPTPYPKLA